MLELENEIESLIESAKDELSQIEKLQIKRQILQAYNNSEWPLFKANPPLIENRHLSQIGRELPLAEVS